MIRIRRQRYCKGGMDIEEKALKRREPEAKGVCKTSNEV